MTANLLSYFPEFLIDATLYQTAAGSTDAAGNWVPGVETTTAIKILALQPVAGETLKYIPDGEEISDFVSTAVDASIIIDTRDTTEDPDEIQVNSIRYEVFTVGRWGTYGGFDKAILRRKS